MLKHCSQTFKRTKPCNDGQDSTCNRNTSSFENAAFSDNDASLCDKKDFEVNSDRRVTPSLTDNSVIIEGLSRNNNNTLHNIRDEHEENPASNEQNSYNKAIIIVIILMTTVFGVCFAVGCYYIGYYPETRILNYGDTKIIDYSSHFCSAVMTDTNDVWLSVVSSVEYLGQVRYTMFTLIYLEVGHIWSRMFHLSKRSTVSINISSEDIIFVLVFKGRHKYDLWLERKTTVSYEMKQACCLNGKPTQRNRIEFSSNEDEDYYFVLYRDEAFGNAVHFNTTFEFIRPKIDSTKIKHQCKTSIYSECNVGLTFGSKEKAIIELHNKVKNRVITKETNTRLKCDARIWFYCIVFGASIIVLSAAFVFLYITVQRYYKSKNSRVVYAENNVYRQAREVVSPNEHTSPSSNLAGMKYSHRSCSSKESSESNEKNSNWAVDYGTCNKDSIEPISYQGNDTAAGRNSKGGTSILSTGEIATILQKEGVTDHNSTNNPLVKYTKRKSKTHGYNDEKQFREFDIHSLRNDGFDEITIDLPRQRRPVDEAEEGDIVDETPPKARKYLLKGADGSKRAIEWTKKMTRTRVVQASPSASSSSALNRHKKSNNLLAESPADCLEMISVEHLDRKGQTEYAHNLQSQRSRDNEIKLIGRPIDI